MGVTQATLRFWGTVPVDKERLKMNANGWEMWEIIDFTTEERIPSNPGLVFPHRFLLISMISSESVGKRNSEEAVLFEDCK